MTPILPPLVLPIAVPLISGLLCLLTPERARLIRAALALGSTAATVVLVWPLFEGADANLEFHAWLSLRVDGLSALILLAIAVSGCLITLYSIGYMRGRKRQRAYFAYLLWTIGASYGAVLANDLLIFLVFWGVLALLLFLLIGLAGPSAAEAARKAMLIVGGADALLVLGVALLWDLTGSTRMDSGPLPVEGAVAHFTFLTFVAAAFAKAGAMPLHSWLPDCSEKALVPVTALLPASLDKLLGVYLLVRCVEDLFRPGEAMLSALMMLGAITIVGGGLMALVQRDLKRLFAYSSISQVGYMVLGIACFTPLGIAAALFHLVNNTVYKSCLFLCGGAVEQAAGTTDLDRLGGLGNAMPATFAVFAVAALSIAGIPPLSGFASKWMIYQGVIGVGESGGAGWIVWLAVAMVGSALTLAGIVKVLHAVFLCKPSPDLTRHTIHDADATMLVPMAVLATICITFGVFANAIPLDLLILPVYPADVPGVWWSGMATVLVVVAIGLGGVIYALTMSAGQLRRSETYIGGERMAETYIRGETPDAARHVEVTGTDFYDALERLPGLGGLYSLARRKLLDIYDLGAASAGHLITVLRGSHTGALPLYLIWILSGLLILLYTITQIGPDR